MKKIFKKVATIAGSALMIGATVGMAAAAAFPAPFVQNGNADVAIVYGANAASTDTVGAFNIQTDLASELAAQTASGSNSGSTVSGGDFVQIAKSTDSFNLGNNLNSFYTSIDGDELKSVLADGVYLNDDNDEFDYNQEVVLGSMNLTHFTDNDFNDEEPVIGFNMAGGSTILNYTLDFTPSNAEGGATDWNLLEGTTIEMLGKEYYVLSASNASTPYLHLLDSADDAIIAEGESVTVAGKEVSINFISSSEVILNVDGETTNGLGETDTQKLADGSYVGIKDILFTSKDTGISKVEFSVGSGKIELVHGEEVQVNGDDVSDIEEYEDYVLNSYVTRAGTDNADLDKFTIEWKLRSGNAGDTWLAFDTDSKELVMPVFNNIKLSLGNFITEAQEVTSIDPDGDDSFTLDTVVTDGEVSLNLLYANSTGTGFAGIGESATQQLVTNATSDPIINWNENSSYFVATWVDGDDHESYVLEVSEIDDTVPDNNATTIKSIASGSNEAITIDIDESDEIGQITFTLDAASETAETATTA